MAEHTVIIFMEYFGKNIFYFADDVKLCILVKKNDLKWKYEKKRHRYKAGSMHKMQRMWRLKYVNDTVLIRIDYFQRLFFFSSVIVTMFCTTKMLTRKHTCH